MSALPRVRRRIAEFLASERSSSARSPTPATGRCSRRQPHRLRRVRSACAIALHMHQPLVRPAAGTPHGPLIGNLQRMFEHPGEGDNHNAPAMRRCYARMASSSRAARGRARAAGDARVLGHAAPRTAADGGRRRHRGPAPGSPACPSTGAPVEWLARRGATRSRRRRRCRTTACMSGVAAPFRRDVRRRGADPRARLLAVRDGAAQPSGGRVRVRTDARRLRLSLVLVRSTRWRSPARGAPPGTGTCRNGSFAATPRARRRASSRSSRRRAPTASSSGRCSVVRGERARACRARPPRGAAARGPDRRRRERGVMMNEFRRSTRVVRAPPAADVPLIRDGILEHLFAQGLREDDLRRSSPAPGPHLARMRPGGRRRGLGRVIGERPARIPTSTSREAAGRRPQLGAR